MPIRSILGRTIDADVRSRAMADWLRLQWEFPEHELAPVHYRVELAERTAPTPRPTGTESTVALHGLELPCIAGDDTWWMGDAHAGASLELRPTSSRIAVWGAEHPSASPWAFAALFVAISESIRASGLLPIHAAVIVKDDAATMLAGRSGVGKSTTLWRAMREGWAPLAEDFAWLDPATLVMYGWDRGLRLTNDARARFAADMSTEQFRVDPDGKLFLGYERLPAPVARRASLARLVLLERDAARPVALEALSPLPARDAVRVWWEAAGVPLSTRVRADQAAVIGALVQRVEALRLELGSGTLSL